MFANKRSNTNYPSSIGHLIRFGIALALTSGLVLIGCDSNGGNAEGEIAELIISPRTASITVGEQVDFSAAALTASGDTVHDAELRWWSTDEAVFTVEDNGLATGEGPGSAFCNVAVTNRPFDGLDSVSVSVMLN